MDTLLIEAARKRKGITQTELAKSIDMTVTGYQKMIRSGDIKVSVLEKISEQFGMSVHTFFGNMDKPKSDTDDKGLVLDLSLYDELTVDIKNKRLTMLKR